MVMTDYTEGKLAIELEFAKSINDDSLQKCIDRLKKTDEEHPEWDTDLFTDFAPHSFYFNKYEKVTGRRVYNGGIIFHGKHDNGGDGGAPTFSISLTPCNGWQIHT
jgi:hypothetical protein